jgi:cytochrome c peroxidase
MKGTRKLDQFAPVLAAALLACSTAAAEDFDEVVKRLANEKATFAERHRDLLAERYDLADRPAAGVTMARGKPVQEGVRVKLPTGTTWEELAAATPDEIRQRNLWPAGFFPLPHPHHEAGGMVFPQPTIDEIKKQTDRDLTRFDLDFDLPQHLLPEFPAPIFPPRAPIWATCRKASSSRSTTSMRCSRTSSTRNRSRACGFSSLPFRSNSSTPPTTGAA